MGKFSELFGGRGAQDDGGEPAEATASEQAPQAVAGPSPIPDALPLVVETNPYATIADYAASLPAPDYADPAGKASARSEAA
jgi:hypothetical protein